MGSVEEEEEGEGAPKVSAQASKPNEATVTLVDEEHDDGAEIENEVERLQAKLAADVKAAERKKDDLSKRAKNFADAVKSRVAVDALTQLVTTASELLLDCAMLIALAAIVACVGLAMNNTVGAC